MSLAVEQSGSADPKIFSKAILSVVNGPGQTVENPLDGLHAIRAKKTIAYSGAGSEFKFAPNGEQLNRIYGHFIIKDGKNQLVEVLK